MMSKKYCVVCEKRIWFGKFCKDCKKEGYVIIIKTRKRHCAQCWEWKEPKSFPKEKGNEQICLECRMVIWNSLKEKVEKNVRKTD